MLEVKSAGVRNAGSEEVLGAGVRIAGSDGCWSEDYWGAIGLMGAGSDGC